MLDVDECKLETYTCDRNATCVNTAGEYNCLCNHGYDGDGKVCYGMNINSIINIILYDGEYHLV